MERKNAGRFMIRDFPFEVKSVDENGRFSGYASVFGVLDSYRDVVAPGAFKKSLKRIAKTKRPLPALWQHKSDEPIGGYDRLEEDDKGLNVEGFLLIGQVQRATEAHALMKARIVSGLSIGFYTLDDSYNDKERVRTLKELDLVEVSPVTFPANEDARVDAIKSKIAHGALPSLPEFEQILREAGFSKSLAAVITNRGYSHLLRGEPEGNRKHPTHASAIAEALAGFSLNL